MHDQFPPNNDVSEEALKLGHEPDRINARTIIYVGIVLVIFAAFAYTTVTIIINNVRLPSNQPVYNQIAADRNKTATNQPMLNKRLANMSSTDPEAEVKAPRLEGMQQFETQNPPYFQSSPPRREGNSPHFHPEDLRAGSDVSKKLGLQSYIWKNDAKTQLRIPVSEAMKLLTSGVEIKDLSLKVQDKPVDPRDLRSGRGTAGNPHLGSMPKSEEPPVSKEGHH